MLSRHPGVSVVLTVAAVVIGTLLDAPAFAAETARPEGARKEFTGLKRLMSEEEYRRAGIDRLTDAERTALDAWLARYEAGELESARTLAVVEAVEGARAQVWEAQTDARLEAKVVGEFAGWTGDTVFRLDNGQVWRQRLPGKFRYDGPPQPTVEIARNRFGFFILKLQGTTRSTGVERIK